MMLVHAHLGQRAAVFRVQGWLSCGWILLMRLESTFMWSNGGGTSYKPRDITSYMYPGLFKCQEQTSLFFISNLYYII
jgi:hypothetical protein